jgi:hypothetical protein
VDEIEYRVDASGVRGTQRVELFDYFGVVDFFGPKATSLVRVATNSFGVDG